MANKPQNYLPEGYNHLNDLLTTMNQLLDFTYDDSDLIECIRFNRKLSNLMMKGVSPQRVRSSLLVHRNIGKVRKGGVWYYQGVKYKPGWTTDEEASCLFD